MGGHPLPRIVLNEIEKEEKEVESKVREERICGKSKVREEGKSEESREIIRRKEEKKDDSIIEKEEEESKGEGGKSKVREEGGSEEGRKIIRRKEEKKDDSIIEIEEEEEESKVEGNFRSLDIRMKTRKRTKKRKIRKEDREEEINLGKQNEHSDIIENSKEEKGGISRTNLNCDPKIRTNSNKITSYFNIHGGTPIKDFN